MKLLPIAAVLTLLLGCSNSPEKTITNTNQPSSERQAIGNRIAGFGTAYSEKGPPCITVNATTKKCFLPILKLPADPKIPDPTKPPPMDPERLPKSDWTTTIGEGEPHYVIIEQQAEHRVVAEWRYNISTDKHVMAFYDPDLAFTYKFLNKDGVKVGEFTSYSWRQCPSPTVEHQRNYVIPGNFAFVADTSSVELNVDYRLIMQKC